MRIPSLEISLALCIGLGATAAGAAPLTIGPDDYANGGALLSDLQQAYGQVVGSSFSVDDGAVRGTHLTAWGLYYNYRNFDETPPAADNFTLRLHNIIGGDPEESILGEWSLGAGTRMDTGDILNGSIDLAIYEYSFDLSGLGMVIPEGDFLLSLINDVGSLGQAQSGGYWHWANGGNTGETTYFRRENAADFPNITANSFQETINWTALPNTGEFAYGERAYGLSVTEVPVPASILLFGAGLLGLRLRRR